MKGGEAMNRDSGRATVLYVGGTGTIGASCVRASAQSGIRVTVLNRDKNAVRWELPDGVIGRSGDVTGVSSLEAAAADGGVEQATAASAPAP